jgi:hypothetical protein
MMGALIAGTKVLGLQGPPVIWQSRNKVPCNASGPGKDR